MDERIVNGATIAALPDNQTCLAVSNSEFGVIQIGTNHPEDGVPFLPLYGMTPDEARDFARYILNLADKLQGKAFVLEGLTDSELKSYARSLGVEVKDYTSRADVLQQIAIHEGKA